jgi:hypothetical protein
MEERLRGSGMSSDCESLEASILDFLDIEIGLLHILSMTDPKSNSGFLRSGIPEVQGVV